MTLRQQGVVHILEKIPALVVENTVVLECRVLKGSGNMLRYGWKP